jgi:hypothetical protein
MPEPVAVRPATREPHFTCGRLRAFIPMATCVARQRNENDHCEDCPVGRDIAAIRAAYYLYLKEGAMDANTQCSNCGQQGKPVYGRAKLCGGCRTAVRGLHKGSEEHKRALLRRRQKFVQQAPATSVRPAVAVLVLQPSAALAEMLQQAAAEILVKLEGMDA